ncbi:MAG: hypothetical protein JOY92_14775 [Verrucomicrobia bacterium]|nr:hypothetical protein [Verrucomicrobiota bacterium]
MLLPWSARALHRDVTSDEIPTWMCGWRRRAIIATCLWAAVAAIEMADLAAQETLRGSLSQQLLPQFQPDRPSAFVTPTSQLVQQFQRALQPALLTFGPFRGELTAGLGVTYDDNANLTNIDRQSEVRFDQSLGLKLNVPLSYLNQIGLQLGATLTEVVTSGKGAAQQGINNNSQPFDISIQPGTNVTYQFIVGDVLIAMHDYLTVLQDPTQDPSVANQSTLGSVTNDAGISALWNLGQLVLGGGFDYSYSTAQASGLTGGDRNTFRPAISAGYFLSPQVATGLNVTYVNSSSSGTGTLNSFAVGPFFHGQLTHAIAANLEGGFYFINASNASSIPSTEYYLTFAVSHQLTRYLQYIASFTRDINFSAANDLSENNNVTVGIGWKLGRDFQLSTNGLANFGKVLSGESPGSFSQYGVNVQLGWSPSGRIQTTLSYEFLVRHGSGSTGTLNGLGGNYQQDRVDLMVSYNF